MLGGLPSNVPLPGELFAEKYRIERVLGKGGMGVVFAAMHIHLHQRFALKVLLPSAAADPDTVQRFLREGRAAVKIRSEHVARVIDVGELADRTPYIVMEYLEGSDFAEVLDGQTQLPCSEAVDYVLQACEAVAEAHSLKIVHRDLKPSNLFLARQPDGSSLVKVLDFGISKMLEPDLAMTRTAAMMGSPLYMSPEQLKSARDVDPRADIWSIGVILYQLIAGAPPFAAGSLPELCAIVLSSPVRWLHREVPGVPPELARVVATCLRTEVAERYVNLADLADAIAVFGTKAARGSADRIVALLGLPETRAVLVPLPVVDASLADTHVENKGSAGALQTTRATWSAPSAPDADVPGRRRRLRVGMGAALLVVAGITVAALSSSHGPFRAPSHEAVAARAPEPAEEPPPAALPANVPVLASAAAVPEPAPAKPAPTPPRPPAAARRPMAAPAPRPTVDAPEPARSSAPVRTPLGAATSSKD